jgi:ABC-2 type transport system ATP-binding protein
MRSGNDINVVAHLVKPVAQGDIDINSQDNRISVPVTGRTKALVAVAVALSEAGIEPEDLTLRRPTLDEVFLHLTGPIGSENSLEVAS